MRTALLSFGLSLLIGLSSCSKKEKAPEPTATAPVSQSSAHPPLSPMLQQGECDKDFDCELTDLNMHTCCSTCRRTGVTREKAMALRTMCAGHQSRCPENKCEYVAYEARCLEGRCVALTQNSK